MLSHFSHVQLFAILWIIACQAPLSMGFSRQYWSGLSFPPPGYLPNPEIKPVSLKSPASVGAFFTTSTTWEAITMFRSHPQDSDPTGLGEASPGYPFFFQNSPGDTGVQLGLTTTGLDTELCNIT